MTDTEVWRAKYQVLLSAVVSVCGMAQVIGKSMKGQECIDLIVATVKAVEDGGKLEAEEQ